MRRLAGLAAAAVLLAGVASTAAPAELGDGARLEVLPAPDITLAETLKEAQGAAAQLVTTKDAGAEVLRRTALRATPGGRRIVSIGRETRFEGPQVLAVVARRGRWLGVLHQWRPNGKVGWIDDADARLVRVPWSIEVDRSERRVLVRHEGKVVERFTISVGRPGNDTPLGRFAVTDRLKTRPGSVYGAGILALSGRQTQLPSGWSGGDRLAFHGSPDDRVGEASSTGCMRVRKKVLLRLMKRIPVGTRVRIKA
jgi:L,D-transpeptidase catalytic domain